MNTRIRDGRIILQADDGSETILDLYYIKQKMRAAITSVNGRNSIYAQWTRVWIQDLTFSGLRAIPQIREHLCRILGKPAPKGIQFGGNKTTNQSIKSQLSISANSALRHKLSLSKGKISNKEQKFIGYATEQSARDLFSKFENWLGMYYNFSSCRPKKWENTNKKYEDNYSSIFNNKTPKPLDQVA